MMFSIFETLALWNINELEWLSDYLRARAVAGGTAPEQIDEHLSWNICERSEQKWKFFGRWFTESELDMIHSVIDESTAKTRTAIARVLRPGRSRQGTGTSDGRTRNVKKT
jgi:hypothetical protein